MGTGFQASQAESALLLVTDIGLGVNLAFQAP